MFIEIKKINIKNILIYAFVNASNTLAHSSIDLQSQQRAELEAEQDALKVVLAPAQQRLTHYSDLYHENISVGEEKATRLRNEANNVGLA